MHEKLLIILIIVFLVLVGSVLAESRVSEFKIEGLISAASPKALKSGLEKKLSVKVVKLELQGTESGWPVIQIEYDSQKTSVEKIESIINEIEDPAGHRYQVHKGALQANAPLTDEEMQIISKLGPSTETFEQVTNPMKDKVASAVRGKILYQKNCSKCHGNNGNGYGPVQHGFTTWPRQLWIWKNTGPETDGYLFSFITNGRSDMPPWGIVLSEKERWDLVSYIKTFEALANQ